MEPNKLVALLGSWSHGKESLYQLLAVALQRAILQGDIPTGTRLPAERQLAQVLAISRTTVVAAYGLLREGEWVESQTGSGTWVRPLSGVRSLGRRDRLASSLARNPLFDTLLGSPDALIDLSKANTGDAASLGTELFSLSNDELAQLFHEQSYAPLGLPALRRAVAARYTQVGLPTTEDQILITTGAQQAISLSATLYVQRGDNVLIENPTYVGAIDAFRAVGGRLMPVPIERGTFRVDMLRGLVKASSPQIIYLTPTFHNPTGAVLPEDARREVAHMAEENGVPVLEDISVADLVLDREGPPCIATFASGDAPILTVGSTSKLFWAGLRVGWVRAPQPIVTRLARLKIVADLGSGLLSEAIAARLISETDRVKALRRQEFLPGLHLLSSLLAQHLPSWTWDPPAGGTFLWVRLPCADTREFAQLALRYGVLVTPGATMSVDESHTSYLRLPFFLEADVLEEGITRLAAAWQAFTGMVSTERQGISVVV